MNEKQEKLIEEAAKACVYEMLTPPIQPFGDIIAVHMRTLAASILHAESQRVDTSDEGFPIDFTARCSICGHRRSIHSAISDACPVSENEMGWRETNFTPADVPSEGVPTAESNIEDDYQYDIPTSVRAEMRQLHEQLNQTLRILSVGTAVHINMLRGTIAKPTVEQILHVLGNQRLSEAWRKICDSNMAEIPQSTPQPVEPAASETTKTDAAVFTVVRAGGTTSIKVVDPDFARNLERRLHAAEAERQSEIDAACKLVINHWRNIVEKKTAERDAALAEVKEANEAMVRVGNNAERLHAEVERLKGEAGNKDITIRVFADELAAQKESKQQVADLQAELRASNRNWERACDEAKQAVYQPPTTERDTLRAEVARLTKERDDASQVSPSEREGIMSHISSMLSDAEQEEFGLTGRQLHMQVLRVLSAYRDSAATVAELQRDRERHSARLDWIASNRPRIFLHHNIFSISWFDEFELRQVEGEYFNDAIDAAMTKGAQ